MEAVRIEHPLEPIYAVDSRVLVLGTMPSPKSREIGFYYGHPQNRFWKVMGALFDEPEPLGIEGRRTASLFGSRPAIRMHRRPLRTIFRALPGRRRCRRARRRSGPRLPSTRRSAPRDLTIRETLERRDGGRLGFCEVVARFPNRGDTPGGFCDPDRLNFPPGYPQYSRERQRHGRGPLRARLEQRFLLLAGRQPRHPHVGAAAARQDARTRSGLRSRADVREGYYLGVRLLAGGVRRASQPGARRGSPRIGIAGPQGREKGGMMETRLGACRRLTRRRISLLARSDRFEARAGSLKIHMN